MIGYIIKESYRNHDNYPASRIHDDTIYLREEVINGIVEKMNLDQDEFNAKYNPGRTFSEHYYYDEVEIVE